MKIYLTRHGQTNLNKKELMQGLTDEPLNETGINQAKSTRDKIGNVKFDAVFASPLNRAIKTASIISNFAEEDIIIDERIIEVNFGKYELKPYKKLGIWMTIYWLFPEIIKTPPTVETLKSMKKRSQSFLRELENKDYENVLIVCHGGIIRALSGYLLDKKSGIKWRPRPQNCEVKIFEYENGNHKYLGNIL